MDIRREDVDSFSAARCRTITLVVLAEETVLLNHVLHEQEQLLNLKLFCRLFYVAYSRFTPSRCPSGSRSMFLGHSISEQL